MSEEEQNNDRSGSGKDDRPTRRIPPETGRPEPPPTRRAHSNGTQERTGVPAGGDGEPGPTRRMEPGGDRPGGTGESTPDGSGTSGPTRKMRAGDESPIERPLGGGRPPDTIQPATHPAGTVIAGRYVIAKKIATGGGEADLYICNDSENPGRRVVVKLYWGELQPDTHILESLKGITHEDIISFLDYGTECGRFFEVMEYAAGGSLSERLPRKPFTEEELTGTVIPEIINGLKFCHDHGIVHRDLKESNLYYRNADGTDVVIGDFGISSMLRGGEVIHFTRRAYWTPEYAAPESYPFFPGGGASVSKEMDYYALGISLIMLTNTNPFPGNQDPQRIYNTKMRMAVPLPEKISDRFATLLHGLLTPTPTTRWGHDEVTRWLKGENVPVAKTELHVYARGGIIYKIGDEEPQTLKELALLMSNHREEALQDIKRPAFSIVIDQFDINVGRAVSRIIEKDAPLENRYLEIMYTLDPSLPYRFAPGRDARTPEELARLIDHNAESWREGIAQLLNGSVTTWLRAIGERERADAWESRVSEFGDIENLENVALETFLQILDPDIGSPRVVLGQSSVSVRCTDKNPGRTVEITVSNNGRGHLHGSAMLLGNKQGIVLQTTRIDANRFGERETAIRVQVDATEWERGKEYRSTVILNTNGGRFEIPIRCRIVFPAWEVFKQVAAWSFWGAVVAGLARGIPSVRGRTSWLSGSFARYIGWNDAADRTGPFFGQFEFAASLALLVLAFIIYRKASAGRNRRT